MSHADSAIKALEAHWQARLPEAFGRLHRAFTHPFVSPCEFLPLEALLADRERWAGMLPQFIPFGHDGAEDFYGFYLLPGAPDGHYPILFWNHEYDHYYPLASEFEAFLGWCVIYGRYLAQDDFDAATPQLESEETQRQEFARLLSLPRALLTDPLPRNERELHERLIASDSQSAYALSQMGSACLGRGDLERARDYFVRASEATPWFADPYYLLAHTYLLERKPACAVERWQQVFRCPIALSTRTGGYDLGEDYPDAEVYEDAAAQFACHREAALVLPQDAPLLRLLLEGDPFDPYERLALADKLAALDDDAGTERELLNALTLSIEDEDIASAYDRLLAFYDRARRPRDAVLCRRDAERE